MISFEGLPLSFETMSLLSKFEVDFVFQPIFEAKTGDVVAYEALMRPKGQTPLEMIAEMTAKGRLHEMEILSFYGAALAYRKRGLTGKLGINSFPSQIMSDDELKEYRSVFGPEISNLVVEILEYSEPDNSIWDIKREQISSDSNIELSLDDFGVGYSDMEAVDMYKPDVVKIDRMLISNIDKSGEKQSTLQGLIKEFKKRKIRILAEGVETKEEYEYLIRTDIDYMQGFYLAVPI